MTFPRDQLYCVFDYESYSEAPLKQVGAYEYSVHPSTEILCAAWRIGTRETLRTAPTRSWTPTHDLHYCELFQAMQNPAIIFVAHNAYFEQVMTHNVFTRLHVYETMRPKIIAALPPSRWLCTASLACALALPRKLEHAAAALRLPVQKDMEGHRLMMKYCKPRKASKNNAAVRHSDPADLARIAQYCETDVATEVELFLKTRPLSGFERKVWELDQAINLRGFQIDRPLVKTVLSMIADETEKLNERCHHLTNGEIRSATQREKVLTWVNSKLSPKKALPNLQKKTVEDAIAREDKAAVVDLSVREMLWLRLATSKTSTAKYEAFRLRSGHDGRVRDNFVYHAASTGRWGGAGVQPQNFPRGSIKDSVQAAGILKAGDLELTRLIYGEPMEVFASCLRACIIPTPGRVIDVADYAAIEVRVLFWLAKHDEGLKAFREGRDLYRELARRIFNTKLADVTSAQRFVGKTAVLGAGYGLGWKKFKASIEKTGQPVTDELAQASVKAYREAHRPVTQLWNLLERAAIAAVENLGKKYSIYRTSWWVKGDILWCELPSGRRLAYIGPRVKMEPKPWGEPGPVLYHYGVNSLSKKWEMAKTWGGTLTENVVQAIARDLMAEAMLRIEARGWEIVLHVHDELVGEREMFDESRTNAEFCALMAEVPAWGEGIPVAVEGWEGSRYKK